jgi:serine protease AprX
MLRRSLLPVLAAVAGMLTCASAAGAQEAIVQLRPGAGEIVLRAVTVTQRLPLIHGAVVHAPHAALQALARDPRVRAVSPNAPVRSTAKSQAGGRVLPGLPAGLTGRGHERDQPGQPGGQWGQPGGQWENLATSFNQSIRADEAWRQGATGAGVAVAVLDTGTAGDLPDFGGRVTASAVVNADATSAGDGYGHGTHVAGLVAGDAPRYRGVAPGANLVSVKVGDDHGGVTVADVVNGLQFVVDHRDELGIRVVNLSLSSSVAESAKTDPLDAAIEATWFDGIAVVVAAGNRGTDADAVGYAPGNDPYAISVGAVDDQGTKRTSDDVLASWSSRGTTQDGVAKPDVVAPGAHIISTLAPGSDFASLCPSCIRDERYFQIGGTSMAAAVVSGAVADLLAAHRDWTPDQLKGALMRTGRRVDGAAQEIDVAAALRARGRDLASPNAGNTPSSLFDTTDPSADWSRISWSRISWSQASPELTANWARISWSCACTPPAADGDQPVDPSRISWSRISWSRISWSRISWSRISWSSSFAK